MRTAGICIGASTITMACVTEKENILLVDKTSSISHEGNPREILLNLLNQDYIKNADRIVVTGRKLRHLVNATTLSEPEAAEEAYKYIINTQNHHGLESLSRTLSAYPAVIVSAGGETFMVYKLDAKGRIIEVKSGNKCASGTGEFFLQQIKRMNLPIDEAVEIADLKNPYKVAGRCSVFCKSDCTHALNKGAAKSSVVAGLCKMMADKITELLKDETQSKVILVGGSSSNRIMVEYLREAGLDVIIPAYSNCFEALGAALWALKNETVPINIDDFFRETAHEFPHHKPLSEAKSKVRFMESVRGKANYGDDCILGLDVGSTTTKAVLMRKEDQAILAGIYLRTNGDPVAASRKCYEGIKSQLSVPVNITGLGVTGSGRQISGLHAQTPAVINEIIAHARAAAFFDPKVDTIFEIGGQDAKYTYLTNGVASDYAMNEACSAGTGSFLEESAFESLNLKVEMIGEIALKGKNPPNFNDQCAAFIGSDIKTAIQNGISREDIAAGLVYSICLNYLNRVKGNRAVGQKVFMQGGVCYNKAVPAAMANLTGREIIVPPEPGLMGAFGVALETMSMLDNGQIETQNFDLEELASRTVTYKEPFICQGGKEKCDRKCQISRITIGNKTYPFGGACNKYYNNFTRYRNHFGNKEEADVETLDLVALRERLLIKYAELDTDKNTIDNKTSPAKKIGISLSLMANTLLPLYAVFFKTLGYEVVYPVKYDAEGLSRKGAAFCWPVEQAHGILQELLGLKPDIVFLPHVKAFPVPGGQDVSVCCPFVQSEPYLLKSAFPELEKIPILSPVLDMTSGYEAAEKAFTDMAKNLGHTEDEATAAFNNGLKAQNGFHEALMQEGMKVLKEIETSPDTAIILFGRPYNAFSGLGNMGIPKKLASRGYRVIPQDFLPVFNEGSRDKMYWASGQWILKAAHFVARHEKLFGVYITNFSCGPDSFLLTYFRNIMGSKPSLTLELDSHTADAGVDTRVEAFLDVVSRYRDMETSAKGKLKLGSRPFETAEVVRISNKVYVVTPDREKYPIDHPKVKILVPSMGEVGAKMLAATLSYVGANTVALPPPGEKELNYGRKYTSCKECLPLLLTFGSLVRYIEEEWNGEDILVNFMPEASGPCRFGQYNVMMRELVGQKGLKNVAMLSLTAENSYAGFGVKFALRAWQSIVISDVLDDMYSAILALAKDPESAIEVFKKVADNLIEAIRTKPWPELRRRIVAASKRLGAIPRKAELEDIPSIALTGEIYVRRDEFSRRYLVDRLSQKGFWVRIAPVGEWIHYCDYIVQNKLVAKSNFFDRVKNRLTCMVKNPYEFEIKSILAQSGLYKMSESHVEELVEAASEVISPRLTGETVLTVGAALSELVEEVDGVIALGPFGCMPARISDALVTQNLKDTKLKVSKEKELVKRVMEEHPALPFLTIETDGNAFPQLIESRLEAFLLQVERVHQTTKKSKDLIS